MNTCHWFYSAAQEPMAAAEIPISFMMGDALIMRIYAVNEMNDAGIFWRHHLHYVRRIMMRLHAV